MATKTVTYNDNLVVTHDRWVAATGSSLDNVVEGWLKSMEKEYAKLDAAERTVKYDALPDNLKAEIDTILG